MLKQLQRDQKGLSLIEIIVVLAIMSVVTAGSLIGLSTLSGRNIRSCYSQLESYMQETKAECMTKAYSDTHLTIYTNALGEVYIKKYVSATEPIAVQIGKKGLAVAYEMDGVLYDAATRPLELRFERATGALKGPDTPNMIRIVDDSGREIVIRLVKQTGKFYRE